MRSQHLYQVISFKKEANSLVIRVPLATIFQSLFIIFPVSTNLQRLRFIWSNTALPLRGKSSTVISGEKPLDCAISDSYSWGVYFSHLNINVPDHFESYHLQYQNNLKFLQAINTSLNLYSKSSFFTC